MTMDGLNFISVIDFRAFSDTNISIASYDRLKEVIRNSWLSLKKFSNEDTSKDLLTFVTNFKKGSKRFRKILDSLTQIQMKTKLKKRANTFFNLLNTVMPDDPVLKILNSQWTYTCYPVVLREFVFKLRNNILGLNTRVSHFNNNVNRGCTFCSISGNAAPPDEDFLHLFFACRHTNNLLCNFVNRFLDNRWDTPDRKKLLVFTGMGPDLANINLFLLTVMTVFLHYIWQCKLRKNLPSFEGLLNEIFYSVDNIVKCSSIIRNDMNFNLPLCRDWTAETSRRRF
jgi:hypothetical protein